MTVNNKDILIIKGLIDNILKKEPRTTFDEYIIATFAAFTHHKKQIILDLYWMDESADKRMRDLIIGSLDKREPNKESKREYKDFSNLPRSEMFHIFNNLKTLIIKTTDNYFGYSYSLSLDGLLFLIQPSSLNKVIIKAKTKNGNNWIKSFWSSYSEKTKKEYAEKHYDITVKEEGWNECWFIINKM